MRKGFYHSKTINRGYPDIRRYYVTSLLKGLKTLSTHRADGITINLGVASHLIRDHNLLNLVTEADAGLDSGNISIGVRNDWPELTSILNKTLDTISVEEHRRIKNKWIGGLLGIGIETHFRRR